MSIEQVVVPVTAGAEFAEALSRKDFRRIRSLLDQEIDFRALTPSRFWEAHGSDSVVDEILCQWFEESDEIESLESLETGQVVDRHRVGYRYRVRNADGSYEVEQQAYYTVKGDRIDWMRIVCSGFRET